MKRENPFRIVRPGESKPAPEPKQDLLDTAQDLLERVQKGEIKSLGFVAVNEDGRFLTAVSGDFLIDDSPLYKGLDVLKARLIDHFQKTFNWE